MENQERIYSGFKNEDKYRVNLISILNETKYENLKQVCSKLEYGFSDYDIIRLANAYKKGNEELNNKIEYILTDCNFHSECSELKFGNADNLINEKKKVIEESLVAELKEIFKKEYLEDDKDSFIPANSDLLKDYTIFEVYFAIDKGLLQKRDCEGLAFELTDNAKEQIKLEETQKEHEQESEEQEEDVR